MNSRNAGRAAVIVVLLAGLGVAPGAAQAQTEAAKQQAKEHHEKARRLYDVGKYNEAIEEYQKVYLLVDDPNMLFNIAQCYRLSDRPEEALRFYRNYLRRSPTALNKSVVDKHIADLERVVEERKRSGATTTAPPPVGVPPVNPPVTTAPPPGTGDPGTGAPPPLTTPPAVTGPGGPGTVTPPPVGGEPPVGVQQSPTIDPGAGSGGGSRVLPYVFLIGGGVFVATAVISGAVAGQKAKELEKLAAERMAFDPDIERAGKAANTLALVSGLVGVAAAITGGILLFTGSSSTPAPVPAAGTAPRRPSVAFFPLAGPQVAGAGAQVTF